MKLAFLGVSFIVWSSCRGYAARKVTDRDVVKDDVGICCR